MSDKKELAEAFFKEAYSQYYPIILRYCTAALNNSGDGEDSAQIVFEILLKKSHTLIDHPNIGGWLLQTAKYVISKKKSKLARERQRIVFVDDIALELDSKAPELDPIYDGISWIASFSSFLSSDEYSLFNDKFIVGMDNDVLSKKYGISTAALKMRLTRIKYKIIKKVTH